MLWVYIHYITINHIKHMPNFNGTGPRGNGPLTGLGRGECAAGSAPGRRALGRRGRGGFGLGRGRGIGRFFGACPFLEAGPMNETDGESLSLYEKELQDELKEVQSLLKKRKK